MADQAEKLGPWAQYIMPILMKLVDFVLGLFKKKEEEKKDAN